MDCSLPGFSAWDSPGKNTGVGCHFFLQMTTAAKLLQSCSTLYDPIDGCPPGSPIPGILQARTLEWVAISFSNAWTWKVKVKLLSRVPLFATPWTAAYQAPPSTGFSRQEYWSGAPLPSLPNDHSLLLVIWIQPTVAGVFLLVDERLSFWLRHSSSLWLSLSDPRRTFNSTARVRAGIN